jgi:(S)-2-hydroxy-acid oxidase
VSEPVVSEHQLIGHVVLTAEDALEALGTGAKGIIVSTHGGRQLDGAVSSLDALPAIVDAVAGRIKVHVDSGIRRGSDIFKALAIGADFCWVGRPAIWGLAVSLGLGRLREADVLQYKGDEGVELALQLLRDELQTTMSLCGCSTVHDITRAHLGRLSSSGEF